MKKYQVVIIGAGAAGLFCGLTLARKGFSVAIFDMHNFPGKKFSVTGGGFCNFTNRNIDAQFYKSDNLEFCSKVLSGFTCNDAIQFIKQFGLTFEERNFGQVFLKKPAKVFVWRLAEQCEKNGVDFYMEHTVSDIKYNEKNSHFSVKSQFTEVESDYLVVATGSTAYPQLGSSARIMKVIQSMGHKVHKFKPALVPFVLEPNPFNSLTGISIDVSVKLLRDGKVYWEDPHTIRPILFTHKGLSGPASLVASCWWEQGDVLQIDFLPNHKILEIFTQDTFQKLRIKNMLGHFFPARLAEKLCPENLCEKKVAETGKKDRILLSELIHKYKVIPTGTEDLSKSEVASGGIAVSDLSENLESRVFPKLYFCGECVDVIGMLGGYNLHWAFASAKKIAQSIEKL